MRSTGLPNMSSENRNAYKVFNPAWIALVLLICYNALHAQQDTLFFDSKWRVVAKDSASYFEPPAIKEDTLYRMEYYYVNGQLLSTGLSQEPQRELWEGEFSWYNKDGSLKNQGFYKNNKVEGKFISFLNGKKLVATYKDGYFISGKKVEDINGCKIYMEAQGDTIKEVIYDKRMDYARQERFSTRDNYEIYSDYYDQDGTLIGRYTADKNGSGSGLRVNFYYDPMRVSRINYYRGGKSFGTTIYYKNGQLRERFNPEPPFVKTFYEQNGKQIGKVSYILDRGDLKPQDGQVINFYNLGREGEGSVVQRITTYVDGNTSKAEYRYENGNPQTIVSYIKGAKQEALSFDETGAQIGKMAYKENYPEDGIEFLPDGKMTYSGGQVVEEIKYYSKEKQDIFSKRMDSTQFYYDRQGKIMDTLRLRGDQNYPTPFSGNQYYVDYRGNLISIQNYADGKLMQTTNFRKRRIDRDNSPTYKKIETYAKDGFNKIKEITFYSNGAKQSEVDFNDYKKTKGTYYNREGELLGNYDFDKKEGVHYEFFDDSNAINLMEVREDGKQIRLLRYDYGASTDYGELDPVLLEDIDINKEGVFYDRSGKELARIMFKNGEPWDGSIYDQEQRIKVTFSGGKKNGLYQKLDYNGSVLEQGNYGDNKKEGTFKTFNLKGILIQKLNYEGDQLEGQSIYYDDAGKQVGAMIYSADEPVTGTLVNYSTYGTAMGRETFKDKILQERVVYDRDGARVTQFENGEERNTIAYYKDSAIKRLEYNSAQGILNGKVISYDEQGKQQNLAFFDKGQLQSGTVFIKPDSYDNALSYMIFNKGKGALTITLIGVGGETLFSATENLLYAKEGTYLDKLGLYLDVVKPDHLF